MDSPKWLNNKKATINPENNDDKCFRYVITVALNHEQIKKDPQRITKIKPFIDKYNWKERNEAGKKKKAGMSLKKKAMALNILYLSHNTEEIRHAHKSKHNLKRENQVIPLMITDGEKWHYLAIKKFFALLREITSKHEAFIV